MAYYQTYQCNFNNRNTNNIRVEFWQKDVFADSITVLPCVSVKTQYYEGQEDKFLPTIIGLKLEVVVRAKFGSASTINAEMFYPESADQWKVIAYCDEVCIFNGFIVNDVEPYQMREKPYNIVIRATDGLMQLKGQPLTTWDGDTFNGRNTILSYLAGAISKTGTEVNIRSYVNTYNATHNDRADSGSPDMLTQTKLHHRSLLKDVNSFYDCYETIERLLKGWCIIYQYEGEYCIVSRDCILSYGNTVWFTEYDYAGNFIGATQDVYGDIGIGKQKFIQPIELNQYASYDAPFKSVKTVFNYEIPEDLVNNQKLQQLGAFISPLSGSGYAAYQKVGWTAKTGNPTSKADYTGSKNTYIRNEVDTYGTETDRYYRIEYDNAVTSNLGLYIENDNTDFFVDENDLIAFEFQVRINTIVGGGIHVNARFVQVLILKDGTTGSSSTDWYSLGADGVWHNDITHFAYARDEFIAGLPTYPNEFVTWSISDTAIPASGSLYINYGGYDLDSSPSQTVIDHRPAKISYTPYLRGARFAVKGDYWKTEQNTKLNDSLEEEIYISDAPKRILKGAMWDSAGTALTNPDWYRYGTTENRHFKEIVNLTRYAHQFRPVRKISGEFKGVMFQTNLLIGSLTMHPICLHSRFYFENEPFTNQRFYIFTAPVEMDWVSARINGTLVEVARQGDAGDTDGDSHSFNYIF
jgi:hypothetical protein